MITETFPPGSRCVKSDVQIFQKLYPEAGFFGWLLWICFLYVDIAHQLL